MAIALIDSTIKASTDAEDVTTDAITTTGATLLVATVSSYGDVTDTSITDSKGNTWTACTLVDSGGAIHLQTFYVENPPGAKLGSGHTVTTVGPSPNLPTVSFAAFSGTAISSVFVDEAGFTQADANSVQAGAVVPTEDGSLIVATAFSNPNFTIDSINLSFNLIEFDGTPSLAFNNALAYLVQGTAASVNPTWTLQTGTNYSAANSVVFAPAPAAPLYTFIASDSASSPDGVADAVTSGIDTTGADLLVVATCEFDVLIGGACTVSDSKSNSWTPLPIYVEGGASSFSQVRIWYSKPTTVGSGHTFTAHYDNSSAWYGNIVALAASGSLAAAPLDQEGGSEMASATTITNGSLTPTQNNELIVAVAASIPSGSSLESVDSGFTLVEKIDYVPGQNISMGLAYKIQTAAAAVNPVWTLDASGDASAAMATFKATTGAAAANKSRFYLYGFGN